MGNDGKWLKIFKEKQQRTNNTQQYSFSNYLEVKRTDVKENNFSPLFFLL